MQVLGAEADFNGAVGAQVVKQCTIGNSTGVLFERDRIEPQLEFVGIRELIAIGFVIDDNQFTSFFKPEVDLSAKNDVFEVQEEIELTFDSGGAGGALA